MTNYETALQYANDIITGSIPACNFVKQACQRFLNDVENPLYYFNEPEADAVITFINNLNLTEEYKSKKFILEPWQTFIVVNIYGIYVRSTQRRKYKYVYIELARKNGKSELVTALAVYHLIFDDDASVVVSANSKDQAKLVDFKKCKQFASQVDKKKKHIRHYYNSLKFGDGELVVTASDPSKLDGFNTSYGILDELHEAPNSLMYNVIKSSMGSRLQPLLVVITTSGFDTNSFCYQLRTYCTDVLAGIADDASQFAIIYTLPEDADYTDSKNWIMANPNLSISVLPEFISSEVNKAVNFEAERNGVRVKHMNQWLKANSEEDWIAEKYVVDAMEKNISMTDKIFFEEPCYVGVDLSSVSDITAVSYMFPLDKLYFFIKYYIPEDSINSNINKEMFKNASANGHITITQGNVVDYDRILQDILQVYETNQIMMVSYDKWNSTQFAIDATQAGLNLQAYSQTAGSLNKPIKEFQKLMLSGGVVLEKNSITKWMIGNVIVKQNHMGNLSIDKSSRSKKIDGVAASLNSLGAYLNTDDNPRYTYTVT